MAKIPFGSIEYVHVPIGLDDDAVDMTLVGVTAELAVVAETANPNDSMTPWKLAFITPIDDTSAVAKVLLDGTLPAGRYAVWCRIHRAPEHPLRKAGIITIT